MCKIIGIAAAALLLVLSPFGVEGGELQLRSGVRQNTLIELFTSQGCSSCPPAERWLGRLQDDPRLWHSLIPLAFHVDYWDYLGWKDRFASPAHSQRQRRYQHEGAFSTVYTPGFLVNGREWRRWFGLAELPLANENVGVLALELHGGRFSAAFSPIRAADGALRLNVAVLGVGIESAVTHGENAGRVLPQDFVVLAHRELASENGLWQGELPAVQRPVAVRLALAAWVSPAGRLAPLQAIGGWLPSD